MTGLAWRTRADALAPAGLVAAGAVARALLAGLRRRLDEAPDAVQGLSLVATRGMLVLRGDAGCLPWRDGVQYCAPAPGAPGLWLPTRLAPTAPADLLHTALQRRAGHAAILLWPAPELVLGLDGALPPRSDVLAWLQRELGGEPD